MPLTLALLIQYLKTLNKNKADRMSILFHSLIEGILLGSIYALVALGFVLVYKSSKILNFAQGELLMVGAYIAYLFIYQLRFPLIVALPIVFLITFFLGAVIYATMFKKLVGKSQLSMIMVTIGLSYLLKAIVQMIWGSDLRIFPEIISDELISIGQFRLPISSLWTIIFCLIFFSFFYIFFKYSKIGISMRATANSQKASMACGIPVAIVFSTAWGISFFVSMVGGAVMARMLGLHTNLGIVGLIVFPVVIIGGLDSVLGAVIAGYGVGIIDAFSRTFLGSRFTDVEVVPFLVLVVILLIRPYGLFGTTRIERL